jgi:aldoxime dehydratase
MQSGFDAWWNDSARVKDPQGYFREILTVPTDRFETISTYNTQVGVARTGCPVVRPIREHNYWGSMRDRLQVSADDALLSAHGEQLPRLGAAATLATVCASRFPRISRLCGPARTGPIVRAPN